MEELGSIWLYQEVSFPYYFQIDQHLHQDYGHFFCIFMFEQIIESFFRVHNSSP